jgi:type II secretory pathway pseudopilin PulG
VKQRDRSCGFTLAELLVSVGVLVLLIFLASQLFKSAATVTTLANKQMDADAQTRQLLDRMAVDFAQMIKRSDVDYYLKSSATPPPTGVRNLTFAGNDTIAFYSTVPGYYPSGGSQSPVSLVAYRVNSISTSPRYNKLVRMGKGLVWNAVSTTDTPVVFMPIPLASPIPGPELPFPTPNPLPTPAWQEIASSSIDWSDSELIGPQVFRFEYYYLLKGQNAPASAANPTPTPYSAMLSDIPWDTRICVCPSPTPTPAGSPSPTPTGTPIPVATPTPPSLCCHVAPEGMQDVAAVVVVIAVIDPKSKTLLDAVDPTGAKLKRLNGADGSPPLLVDFAAGMTPGQLLAQWRAALDANTVGLPPPAISGIRVYERYLYLSPPTLLTP